MQKLTVSRTILLSLFGIAVSAMLVFAVSHASAQTITPPTYPNTTLPVPDLDINASAHWQAMAPQGGMTAVPNVPLTKVDGSVHWADVQPESSSTYWRDDLGSGMGMTTGATSTTPSTVCDNTSQFWPVAIGSNKCAGGDTTASQPNNIVYDLIEDIPTWATASWATHADADGSIIGWNIFSNSCVSGTCTMIVSDNTTGTDVTNMVTGSVIQIEGNANNAQVSLLTASDDSTTHQTTVTFATPGGVAMNASGYVTYTGAEPPNDVYGGTCPTLPDGSTALGTGDCHFKAFVTWIMMHTCGDFNLTAKPASPLSTCVIHYFEGANEFSGDLNWTGGYGMLATMMSDADIIIHEYCDDCFFIIGAPSEAAMSFHGKSGGLAPAGCVVTSLPCDTRNDSSQMPVEALGQVIRDWYSVVDGYTGTRASYKDMLPDAVALHSYSGWGDIYMQPMPETNAAAVYDPTLSTSVYHTGANLCTSYQQATYPYGISTVTVGTSGGTGYQVNDILTVIQHNGSGGEVEVTSIGTGGVITGLSVVAADLGTGYSVANGLTVTGGHGTGGLVDITAIGLGNLEYNSTGGAIYVGLPAACYNVCGRTYTGGSYVLHNPITQIACTAYVSNPPSGDALGNALPGCGAQNANMSIYGTRYDWYEPDNTTGHIKPLCIDSYVNSIWAVRQMLYALGHTVDTYDGHTEVPSTWAITALPIWNTEFAWGSYADTDFQGQTLQSAKHDPSDSSLTTFYQQAYIARAAILGAEVGAAVNLWYQWDEQSVTQNPDLSVTQSFINWGQLGNTISGTSGTERPAAYTFNRVLNWLSGTGVVFNGTAPAAVWAASHVYAQNATISDGQHVERVMVAGTSGASAPAWAGGLYSTTTDSTVTWEDMGDFNCSDTSTFTTGGAVVPNVWTCPLKKTSPSGYLGTLAWYTPLDSTINLQAPYGCEKDIDGKLTAVTVGTNEAIYNRPVLFDNTASGSCTGTDGLPAD